jgi:hypothetical protein
LQPGRSGTRSDVAAHDFIEILFQGFLDRTELCDPRIGKKDVEMAEFVLDPVEKAGARVVSRTSDLMAVTPNLSVAAASVAASRPVIATRAPSATNRRAAARPIPLSPPVIAVLPFNNTELTSLSVDIVSSGRWISPFQAGAPSMAGPVAAD